MSGDLARAVGVDEAIKEIATASFQMRLEATNAIILTRARAVAVPGFEAVSLQMGALSRELAAAVDRLRERSLDWLRAICAQVKRARSIAALAAADAAAPGKAARVLARLRAAHAEHPELDRGRRAFERCLDDARALAATGCVLARSAKLEAVYGGELAASLSENASTFTTLADGIFDAVRVIERRTHGGT